MEGRGKTKITLAPAGRAEAPRGSPFGKENIILTGVGGAGGKTGRAAGYGESAASDTAASSSSAVAQRARERGGAGREGRVRGARAARRLSGGG